jgi:Lon protease-like protein
MKISDRYRSIASLPVRLPMFPLRGTILLPRASLPLNIFEPRYLKMFDDVISGDRLVGVVQPDKQAGEGESPINNDVPLRRIGAIGRVTAFQELDDGRFVVSIKGVARCSIVHEPPSGLPYRICQVDYSAFANDLMPGLGETDVDREALLTALKAFLEARHLKADWTAIGKSANEALVNSLALMSPYGAEEKQALLEAVDLKTRAEVLVALAEMELAGSRQGGTGSTLQ